ncbi:MAG: phosphoglucomutase, alpha-D-glucose phosphate-specific [Gemmatimonadetes bacterium]|nr:phosphoglucomutase, alpha-D-glucose phosphate-specific [Gemmatimonadota bacterium]
MSVDPRAGHRLPPSQLADIPALLAAYADQRPDPAVREQRVSFGTSGHRGSSLATAFNEWHILAITQAIVEYRAAQGIDGPLFLGIDTHALSRPAMESALEVLAANEVRVMIDANDLTVPTPALSHAILRWNAVRSGGLADGIVVTPSHNPPEDGGFKYNPPNGGPADTRVTGWIQDRANELLAAGLAGVRRIPLARAMRASTTQRYDFRGIYVDDLANVVDFDAIRAADIGFAVDPLGGAGVAYWPLIAERHRIPLEVLSQEVDPAFGFMTADWDGRIRMDCSSPWAMQPLIAQRDRFDVAWACDTDHDRHGIVARSAGLLNPNHYLATCIAYLFSHRPDWALHAGVGKTIVSSSMIDRVAARLGRPLLEVPVGFKWFVDGLMDGSLGFVGEESAGATLLRRNGTVWTTDKDGIALGLLAAEMTAVVGRDPGEQYATLVQEFGAPAYARIDAPASREQKAVLAHLGAADIRATQLAGESILATMTAAPTGASIGGIKVVTESGWFAARPSGTEEVYKLYAESFRGPEQLARIQQEAQEILASAFDGSSG